VDLVADGGGRNVQLVSGLAEAHVAGGRFKSPKSTQRWKMAVHPDEKI
jgi:hypothetical protein